MTRFDISLQGVSRFLIFLVKLRFMKRENKDLNEPLFFAGTF